MEHKAALADPGTESLSPLIAQNRNRFNEELSETTNEQNDPPAGHMGHLLDGPHPHVPVYSRLTFLLSSRRLSPVPLRRVTFRRARLISKRLCFQINCVTFPLPGEGPEQQLLKPNEWSYCDYFWVSVHVGSDVTCWL